MWLEDRSIRVTKRLFAVYFHPALSVNHTGNGFVRGRGEQIQKSRNARRAAFQGHKPAECLLRNRGEDRSKSTFYYFHISDLRRTYLSKDSAANDTECLLSWHGTARGEAAKFICLAQTVIAVPMHDSILEPEGYKFQECYGSNSNMPRRPTIRTINHINRQPTPPITMLLFRFYNCNRKPFGWNYSV